ncbi:hypothetical protein [Hymenobacter ruricola]|uniref:Uncharacterized protein n=1 Tax=Hymenobacter ruricola TaxID=2791023 RepID=A0ABS0I0M7_9BACT|nr:hypothetical protein [Hymenobacter ruricola]MBF9220172.1 hypothetical protein [Hymenobacter ruricola]
MKSFYRFMQPATRLMSTLVLLLFTLRGHAQQEGISTIHPGYFNSFNCFPGGVPAPLRAPSRAPETGTAASLIPGGPGPGPTTPRPVSYNGMSFSPKGTLKVLVIYAGFTNDNVQPTPNSPNLIPNNNNDPQNPWPQRGGSGTNPNWG